jgi:hypothetical protein
VPATSQVALTCRRSAYKEIGLWPHPGRCPAIQVRWLLPPSRRATACSTLHVTYPSWMANENERKPAAPPPLPSLTDEGARVQLARERAREIIELLTELDTRLATKFREWLTVALVHGSTRRPGSPQGAQVQSTRRLSGIPKPSILFRTLQPTLASTRCPCSVRLRIVRPMMLL